MNSTLCGLETVGAIVNPRFAVGKSAKSRTDCSWESVSPIWLCDSFTAQPSVRHIARRTVFEHRPNMKGTSRDKDHSFDDPFRLIQQLSLATMVRE